jgi:hypothetical protein
MSLAPGLGPWGAKASDRTGQGRVGVVTSTSTQLSRLPVGERGGEEKMSEDKKPSKWKTKTIRLTGWVLVKKKADQPQPSRMIIVKPKPLLGVKPRQKKPETERREDVKRRINEELEIYEKCYRFFKRTSSKIIRDYTAEQILRRAANLRGEK